MAGFGKDYATFLDSKARVDPSCGLDISRDQLNPMLYGFQADLVMWALRKGRAALFCDCGMGKTVMQLDWARLVPGRVIILAPLAVAHQTVAEGAKFGIQVVYCRNQVEADTAGTKIVVTNYERIAAFDPTVWGAVVLDESSILKSYDGKFRTRLIESFAHTPYRLACTATPAPNDFMELGNHAEFLGVMTRPEMLAMYFVHDGGETQKWRLKGHATTDFWRWLCSWSAMLRRPSDLGYDDGDFVLPPLTYHDHRVLVDRPAEGMLFALEAQTLSERITARRESVRDRVTKCAELVNGCKQPWLVWCNLNSESTALERAIPDGVAICGSDSLERKEFVLDQFCDGAIRVLITKPSIAGFGLNFQHCHNMAFVGLSDSWEMYYQAVRRCWRFGQTSPVDVHVISATTEGAVVNNIKRKERDAITLAEGMVEHMRDMMQNNVRGQERRRDAYEQDMVRASNWRLHLGDCVDVLREEEDDSVHYSIFSPPFASLYTYSSTERDMGNCKDHSEFFKHFLFLIDELKRVTMPGRLVSIHCMNLPTSKTKNGYIGIRDFRGEIIKHFELAGFIYHSEVCIWKDPVTAMQRTKALGLLYKQLKKDSAMSRMGIPDYLVTFRNQGENTEPISHTPDDLPVSLWQRYASPIWTDIRPNDTLQYRSAREHNDERHICPLQLSVISRGIELWSNPGDIVLDPFAGIGSTGVVALDLRREFLGVELKTSYYSQAKKNLEIANKERDQCLFPDNQMAESITI